MKSLVVPQLASPVQWQLYISHQNPAGTGECGSTGANSLKLKDPVKRFDALSTNHHPLMSSKVKNPLIA